MEPEDENSWTCLEIKHAKGTIRAGRLLQLSDLSRLGSSRVIYVIPSERILISREAFPPLPKEILSLQVDERIRPIGPWPEGIDIHHCLHLLSKGIRQNEYATISLPAADVEAATSLAAAARFRLQAAVPRAAAVAGLVSKLTDDPVLCCFLAEGIFEITAVEKGAPFYSQIAPIDDPGILDDKLVEQTIFSVRQIIDSRFRKSVKKTVFFNRYGHDVPDKIGETQIWKPDWSRVIQTEQPETISRYPELAGALFAHKSFNCLPPAWQNACRICCLNRLAATAALAGSLALCLSGIYLHGKENKLISQYDRTLQEVQAYKAAINEVLPDKEATDNLSRLLHIWQRAEQQPRMEKVLMDISGCLPESVAIAEFKTEREKAQNSMEKRGPEPAGEDGIPGQPKGAAPEIYEAPLVMHLFLTSKGNFQEIRTRFEKSIAGLKANFPVTGIQWIYKEDKRTGVLNCRLNLFNTDRKTNAEHSKT